ncbi:781_t:CDS:2, partial [Funneliformis geosporum]
TYKQLHQNGRKSVIAEEIVEEGETRHKITDIIGSKDGLGVECLKGSGLIAGITSRALVVQLVCIGAYLVRLGQRTIQNEGQPIILTGAPALNKVLGREIMQWLSYVPAVRNSPVPIFMNSDTWDRDVNYMPSKGPYDPRWLIAGKYEIERDPNSWVNGFFVKGSFVETLSGLARTVVVGRARLGGIPMGVIAVETRTVESIVPADPANADSHQQLMMEAGQV